MQTTNMPAIVTGAVPPDNGEEPQRTGIPLSAAKKNFSKVSESKKRGEIILRYAYERYSPQCIDAADDCGRDIEIVSENPGVLAENQQWFCGIVNHCLESNLVNDILGYTFGWFCNQRVC
jgi:hypothetical protein